MTAEDAPRPEVAPRPPLIDPGNAVTVWMDYWVHKRLTPEERLDAWAILIEKAGITGAYLPIPARSHAWDAVGLSIFPVPDVGPVVVR